MPFSFFLHIYIYTLHTHNCWALKLEALLLSSKLEHTLKLETCRYSSTGSWRATEMGPISPGSLGLSWFMKVILLLLLLQNQWSLKPLCGLYILVPCGMGSVKSCTYRSAVCTPLQLLICTVTQSVKSHTALTHVVIIITPLYAVSSCSVFLTNIL